MVTKGLLVVSFGTSFKETREKCIDSIENRISKEYSQYNVKRAFTSKFIIKKLKERDNIYIETPIEAIEKMIAEGIVELHIQPLHVIPGFEYEKIQNAIAIVKHKTDIKITIGSPLLNKEHHYDNIVDVLLERLPKEINNEGIILMGHGTQHFANACYSMLQNKLSDKRSDIHIANIEGYPKINHIVNLIVKKYKKVTIMPLMIVAGDHAMNDMAGDEDSYKTLLEERGIEVTCILEGLGENKGIHDALINRINETLSGE